MDTVAFLSYAHLDDEESLEEISAFHRKLQSELRIHTGTKVTLFFDKKDIIWGKRWSGFIKDSLGKSAFLIPIITPSYFNSKSCYEEYSEFAASEHAIGRQDLVLPVFYVDCPEYYDQDSNSFAKEIFSRQYVDWRRFRDLPSDSTEIRQKRSELARLMAKAFFDLRKIRNFTKSEQKNQIESDISSLSYQDKLYKSDICYETLLAYAVEIHPRLPVSPQWTRAILEDIDRNKYKTIGDINDEVVFAQAKLREFAQQYPELFRYSTDYITKALILTDADFRARHSVSEVTRKFALVAGLTRK